MQRKETLSFKTEYSIALAFKLFIFAICVSMIILIPTDLSIKALGGILGFAIFLAGSFATHRCLVKSKDDARLWIIVNTFLLIIFLLATQPLIGRRELLVLSLSMIAGYALGMIVGEKIYFRSV